MPASDRAAQRVVLDVQALQNPLHRDRGIGRYLRAHADALLDADAPIAALVLNPDQPAPPELPRRWTDAGLVRWNEPALARKLGATGFTYHVMSPFEPAVPDDGVVVRHMLDAATTVVATLYDAIPFVFPDWYQRDDATRSFFRRRAELLRVVDAVLAISEHTRRDAIERLGLDPARVHHIGSGPSPRPDHHGSHMALPVGLHKPFVLTVTGWGEPRKDPNTTFAAFAALPAPLRAAHQLVVVCDLPDEGRTQWRADLRALGLADDDVVLTGHVDDATLDALYTQASLFVFSSRYEGFGLPALEAAVAGAPVITTDVSSLPEVIDHELARVPSDDAGALTRRMAAVLDDESTQTALRRASGEAARRHTWPTVADRTITAYAAASASRPTRHRVAPATRPRLALIGPFPPSKSGIATWSERLVGALAPHADVDVFREGDVVMPQRPAGDAAARRFPVAAFGRAVGGIEYDAPIYTIGNGYHHRHTLEAALRTPGIVWLHETRLAGLYLTRAGLFHPGYEPTPAELEHARRTMADAVVRLHPAAATPLGDDDWWRTEAYDERGYSFLSEIVDAARAVIVSTDAAAEAVHEVAQRRVRVHVLPLPFSERSVTRVAHHDDERWIVSFGWVDPIKQPDVLVRALAAVVARGHDARLAFVGELAPTTKDVLDGLAGGLGVVDRVQYTGFVTSEEYDAWLARADIAVQLRAVSRGEASAALNDTLAAGIATVTNIPTARDLPDDVVVRIDGSDPDLVERALTDELDGLLGHPDRSATLATAARSHARRWRFDDLAQRVLEVVRNTPRPPVTAGP
jgi:glycosyltransferase involved in cell wall biosynthesis